MNAAHSMLAAPPRGPRRHASDAEYASFVRRRHTAETARKWVQRRRRFVRAYPDLDLWFAAPLEERVGRFRGETRADARFRISYVAQPYLAFLATRGYAWFDWEWLLAMPSLYVWGFLGDTPLVAGVAGLVGDAIQLGYAREAAERALEWSTMRLFLHTLDADIAGIDAATIDACEEAIRRFGARPDIALFFGSRDRYLELARHYVSYLQMLRTVLYHRGQLAVAPRRADYRGGRPIDRPSVKPRMEAVARRYLDAKRLNSRPKTVAGFDLALGHFIGWIAATHPDIDSFAQVGRMHALEYAEALNGMVGQNTGRPMSVRTKESYLSGLSVFCRETAAWGWDNVPGRPLLGRGELPKIPHRVPRYIPDEERARLMVAVRALACPYQRAALLIARWSGARRDEIRRLEMGCLDAYPDGTPRLRIPAGKTYAERLVPLNEEAAETIRHLQALRRGEPARGFRDELTGTLDRRLFVHHGKPFSAEYLFEAALRHACRAAGLVTPDGKPTITAHRFRHTVGTQLAEKGARLHTIMTVLGHQSVGMSVVYAQIGDKEVLKDYQAVLGPGATIAGSVAVTVRAGGLPVADVEWLKRNFFKTELELGHCLRLPHEGPCECDLYLTCAKFVTTPEYAPRLRARRRRERELIAEAAANGWEREVERHRCTAGRIEQLLAELGEPIEAPEGPTREDQ